MRTTTVHRCLLEVKSMGGAEFQPVILNITLGLVMMMGPGFLWWPVITYFIHKLLQWMFSRDSALTRIFAKYMKEGDFYDPWPRANQFPNRRPNGAGRNLLC